MMKRILETGCVSWFNVLNHYYAIVKQKVDLYTLSKCKMRIKIIDYVH